MDEGRRLEEFGRGGMPLRDNFEKGAFLTKSGREDLEKVPGTRGLVRQSPLRKLLAPEKGSGLGLQISLLLDPARKKYLE
jgi:hypothetical protein